MLQRSNVEFFLTYLINMTTVMFALSWRTKIFRNVFNADKNVRQKPRETSAHIKSIKYRGHFHQNWFDDIWMLIHRRKPWLG